MNVFFLLPCDPRNRDLSCRVARLGVDFLLFDLDIQPSTQNYFCDKLDKAHRPVVIPALTTSGKARMLQRRRCRNGAQSSVKAARSSWNGFMAAIGVSRQGPPAHSSPFDSRHTSHLSLAYFSRFRQYLP